jgi:hypothetical protein
MKRSKYVLRMTFKSAFIGFQAGVVCGFAVFLIYGQKQSTTAIIFCMISFTVSFGVMGLFEALKRSS